MPVYYFDIVFKMVLNYISQYVFTKKKIHNLNLCAMQTLSNCFFFFIKIISKLNFVHFWNIKWYHVIPQYKWIDRNGANTFIKVALQRSCNYDLYSSSYADNTTIYFWWGGVLIWLILMLIPDTILIAFTLEMDNMDYGYRLITVYLVLSINA